MAGSRTRCIGLKPHLTMTALLTLLCVGPLRAEELETLDAEFLEYLLKYEGPDDNWTVVTQGAVREQVRELADESKRTRSSEHQKDTQP